MITIVEPKEHIARLWGKQKVRESDTYRLMRYVLRVDHEGKVLLHNVVTGQLVVLSEEEARALDQLPSVYTPTMEQLVSEHYLVPEDFDEHQQVVNLRSIFQKLIRNDTFPQKAITNYTIVPTTACNARCYYCYEQGIPIVTMTEQTADDTVKYITDNCGEEKQVSIRWFGGEPTVAADRIDQICRGLQRNGVQYSSSMTTNGYLFDEDMVSRAKRLWNLKDVMICVDGTEEHYNETKAYVNAKDNPYQRVLRNVGLLLDQEIVVSLRMNFDLGNYQDFKDILSEASERFQNNGLLSVYAFPIEGAHPDHKGKVLHASEAWLVEKLAEMNAMAQEAGLYSRVKELPSMFLSYCQAGSPRFMVITAEGKLGRCGGIFFEEDQIVGSVQDGLYDDHFCDSWRKFADPAKCRDCTFFPSCVLIEKCPANKKGRCFFPEECRQYTEAVRHMFAGWTDKGSC